MEERLVIGLGNPGPAYVWTRHNAGFLLLDQLIERLDAHPLEGHDFFGLWQCQWRDMRVLFMKPMTLMNLSGHAVGAFLNAHPLALDRCLVAYDDLALPLGSIRIRPAGSAGGQKGLRHIINVMGTSDIPRIRIGIGADLPIQDRADYVLSEFDDDQMPLFRKGLEHAAEAVIMWLNCDIDRVMASFNGKSSTITPHRSGDSSVKSEPGGEN